MSERLKACAKELVSKARAKVQVIGVETSDEDGLRLAVSAAAEALSKVRMPDGRTVEAPCGAAYWSCAGGFEPGGPIQSGELSFDLALAEVDAAQTRAVVVFWDVWPYVTVDAGASALQIAAPVRRLREMVRRLKDTPAEASRLIVLVSRRLNLPADLRDEVPIIKLGLPQLEDHISSLKKALAQQGLPEPGEIELRVAAEAGLGLSSLAFCNAVATSLVKSRTVDVSLINAAKQSALEGSALRWINVPKLDGVSSGVAGLENVKAHISRRIKAWSPEARALGLEQPKGIILTGVQGCGKTALAIAVAGWLGVPLVEMSFAGMMSMYLGQSEQKLATALDTIDVLGRCVVLCDEVEKAVGGSGGELDGNTNTRMLGEFLGWLQKKTSPSYIIATSNRIDRLPAELTRKGRFDETFFVDLPTSAERKAILELHLRKRGLSPEVVSPELIKASEKFSGAELEAVVVEARFAAFDASAPLSSAMLLDEIKNTVPLATSAADKIRALRETAGNIRPASKPEQRVASTQFGALEL